MSKWRLPSRGGRGKEERRCKRFVLFGFALLAAVGVVAGTASARAAGDTTCTGALGAVTVNGNLNVPAGASCTLTGTHVRGNVTVKQGPGDYPALVNLTTTGATIDGNVYVQKGGTSSLESSTVVGGNYQCDQCQFADLNNSTVKKNFQDNGIQLGAFIGNDTIGGNLEIQNGLDLDASLSPPQPLAGFNVDGNSIGGNFQFNNNNVTGAVNDITSNTIKGNLYCQGNTPPPTGSGNTAKQKQGQCAAL